MSMLDSFFSNKGFKGSKCKTLLKLTIPRIKLLRNRRELQIKQMRKDIAKLLETGQEATARIRVEHIIREENMMAAQEIIELFCELITVRLPIIESQRECPLDLKEAIASICFAAPRCADLPELLQVQLSFASKYGKEFIAAATELMPDCGVNRQLVELLSVRAPSPEKKLKLLKEIAEEHELEWDPSPSESELFKSHEDLLNGPRQFISGSKVPLPKEKHDDTLQSTSVQAANEYSDDEDGLDELDFPEVPKVPLRTNAEASTPQESAFQFQQPHIDPEDDLSKQESLNPSSNPGETKQFLPFISPPSLFSSPSLPMKESEQSLPPPSRENEEPLPPLKESEYFPPPQLRESEQSPPPPLKESEHIPSPLTESVQSSPPLLKESSFTPPPVRESSISPPLPKNNSDTILDLNDVLAAAKAAAESAERAAAAARSAASLAEIRISELSGGKSDGIQSHESEVENPFHASNNDSFPGEHFGFDEQSNGLKHATSINETRLDSAYISSGDNSLKQELPFYQPQRIPSMEDDPEFSYPNLFSSHSGNMFSGSFSTNNSQPPHGS